MPRSKQALTIAVAMLLLSGCYESDEMPNVIGMRKDAAAEALDDAGINDWTEHWIEGSKPMVVTRQSPEAGESVTPGEDVEITLDGR